ncbi:hypothetical protein KIN20_026267 [Parelaphostrongylus tenuis]|uniref:Uncharacterized protein n=1 Tax=Parelaphostrongylus tenuis TaxID=148309 RepID=A0AAD5NA47_PARTN|nr:hypothetical protein KIN20_026267 [Parelaphostrongylus tenuis]
MASWSKAMGQSIMNRAIRMLALGPFESHFFAAFGTVVVFEPTNAPVKEKEFTQARTCCQ